MGATAAPVVTDRTVGGLWGEALRDGLTGCGLPAGIYAVEPGERAKSLAELERVLDFLETSSIDRRGVVIALGAFWQPALVVSDLALLETLPDTDYLAAFGEIVKYAVAMDSRLAERLEADAEPLLSRSTEALEPVVT